MKPTLHISTRKSTADYCLQEVYTILEESNIEAKPFSFLSHFFLPIIG